jgi:hypothetical protein
VIADRLSAVAQDEREVATPADDRQVADEHRHDHLDIEAVHLSRTTSLGDGEHRARHGGRPEREVPGELREEPASAQQPQGEVGG